jgi:hypothetical protein
LSTALAQSGADNEILLGEHGLPSRPRQAFRSIPWNPYRFRCVRSQSRDGG